MKKTQVNKGKTIAQADAKFGTVRLQRYGPHDFATEVWAPDLHDWSPIDRFEGPIRARHAYARSLKRLNGQLA